MNSGLDSSTSTQVISLLKALANGGRIVICSIHQPSSTLFAMFDQIYLMAEGYCIYSGPRLSLVPFLADSIGLVCPSDHNPADFGIILFYQFSFLSFFDKNHSILHSHRSSCWKIWKCFA